MSALSTPPKRMLTTLEAANYCGFESANGFLAYVDVRPVKFGKKVCYDRVDLDAFLDRLRTPGRRSKFAELAGESSNRGH